MDEDKTGGRISFILKKLSMLSGEVALFGLTLGVLFWVIEANLHFFTFKTAFIKEVFMPDPHEYWMRSIATVLIYLLGFIAQFLLNKSKQAEEETKLAYFKLNQIFQTAADGMRLVDKNFTVSKVNETFSKISGIRMDEATGRKCYEVFHGPTCHTQDCSLIRILGGEECITEEVIKESIDGARIPCIVTATAFRGPDGELIGIVEDFKDITEQYQAKEKVRVADEEKAVVLNSMNERVVYQDLEHRVLLANKAAGLAARMHPQEMTGRYCYDIWVNRSEPCIGCPIEKARKSGKLEIAEMATRNGKEWLIRGYPVFNEKGKIKGFVEVSLDLTEVNQRVVEFLNLFQLNKIQKEFDNVLVYTSDKHQLLYEICRIIRKIPKYCSVWIGFAEDDETRSLRPVAQEGFEEGYLESIDFTWADNEKGSTPQGMSIRTGEKSIVRNALTDPNYTYWRHEAIKYGYTSLVALPMRVGGKIRGVLTVHAQDPDAFKEEDIMLLENLANHLSRKLWSIIKN